MAGIPGHLAHISSNALLSRLSQSPIYIHFRHLRNRRIFIGLEQKENSRRAEEGWQWIWDGEGREVTAAVLPGDMDMWMDNGGRAEGGHLDEDHGELEVRGQGLWLVDRGVFSRQRDVLCQYADRCMLPADMGTMAEGWKRPVRRYSFTGSDLSNNGSCVPFRYLGANGNANNFKTIAQCRAVCVHRTPEAIASWQGVCRNGMSDVLCERYRNEFCKEVVCSYSKGMAQEKCLVQKTFGQWFRNRCSLTCGGGACRSIYTPYKYK